MRSLPLLLALICLTNGKIQLTTTVLKERIARLSYWYSEDAVLGDQPFRNLDSSVEYLNKMVETVIYLSASEAVEYNVTNNVINFDLTMRKQEVDLKSVNKTAFETELFWPAMNLSSALIEKVLKPNQRDMQLFYKICAANKPGVLLGRAPKILSKDTVTMSYLNATNYGSKEFLRYAIFARRLTMHLLAMVHFCDNKVPPGLDEDLKHIRSNFGLVDFELKMTGDHRKDHWPRYIIPEILDHNNSFINLHDPLQIAQSIHRILDDKYSEASDPQLFAVMVFPWNVNSSRADGSSYVTRFHQNRLQSVFLRERELEVLMYRSEGNWTENAKAFDDNKTDIWKIFKETIDHELSCTPFPYADYFVRQSFVVTTKLMDILSRFNFDQLVRATLSTEDDFGAVGGFPKEEQIGAFMARTVVRNDCNRPDKMVYATYQECHKQLV